MSFYDPKMMESCVILAPTGTQVWRSPIPVSYQELDSSTARERWVDELVARARARREAKA